MKSLLKFLTMRVTIVALMLLLQIFALITVIWAFKDDFLYFYAICLVISAITVVYILNKNDNPSYKIAWIVPILVFPIFGGLFYLMFGASKLSKRTRNNMLSIENETEKAMAEHISLVPELARFNQHAANQSKYIEQHAKYPAYHNTYTEYLSPGERKMKRLVEALKQAEHYIFLEYFIIEEGIMWDEILQILEQKAAAGLDIRVIYDDMGCITKLPYNYYQKLQAKGIKCCVFNKFRPVLSARMNNRDHRKIAVIDGYIGFTGGINLADEYINAYPKLGHWKDASIMLKGEAVWNLTIMFLTMWDNINNIKEDFEQYRPHVYQTENYKSDGYVQPFADNPLDDEPVGETVYLNLINKATRYIYINTPYLIIDFGMINALCNAAKSGVDVRIVTPYIADKWFVHAVTRSNYQTLIENGVRIYEYTPGFMHSKTFAVDDEYSVVGTINLDYRSLYLHFECGVWMYKTSSVLQVREDFLETLHVCKEIMLEDYQNIKWFVKLGRSLLGAVAPLL